jgi:hypothetical protein
MKKLSICLMLLISLALPALAQCSQYQCRLSNDDQKRFDSDYQHWLEAKRSNDRDDILSNEKHMQDIMGRYNIPSSVPYDAVASSGAFTNYDQYRNRLPVADQTRFDGYFQRWVDYERTNNREEMLEEEKHMQDVMLHYGITLSVPYRALSSSTHRNYGAGYVNQWQGRLPLEDQQHFDDYYAHWLDARRVNDRDQSAGQEAIMRDVMRQYGIPSDVPFDQIASPDLSQAGFNQVRILDATYGAGERFANVAGRLQDMVKNNRLTVRVNNESMGGDPAPHMRKALNLTFAFRGRQQHVTVVENDTLNIP